MTHGEEEAQTKIKNRKEPCPHHDIFFVLFGVLGELRRNRKKTQKIMMMMIVTVTHCQTHRYPSLLTACNF